MDELQLIKRCLTKDKRAWDEFVVKYSRLIYNYIYSVFLAKGRTPSSENVADIYQGIFLSLYENNLKRMRSFKARNDCAFPSYLRVITINAALDHLRKNSRTIISLDEEPAREDRPSLKDAIADEKSFPDQYMASKEKHDQLLDCVKTLTAQEKYLVQMHIYQGLNMEELAKLCKASRGTLDMRKSRILEKLKNCFRRKKFMLDY